jgi:toxin ParE1/3/4
VEVIWTRQAIRKVNEITDRIAGDNYLTAEKWKREIFRKTDQLTDHPRSGRMVPEYNEPDLREIISGNYRLIYRIKDHESKVYMQTVRHVRQQSPDSSEGLR